MSRAWLWSVIVVSALGCGTPASSMDAGAAGLTPAKAVGSWTGSWNNTTFGSTGASKATVTTDEATKKVTFKLDLDGNVFGGVNPPEETFTGTYDDAQFTVSGSSATFGMLSLTVKKDGTITGSATPTRGTITLTGSASETKITINYLFTDGTKGTLTLQK